jgi:hypothetical protein
VSYAVESSPQGLAIADVNLDGNPDVLVANECGQDPACRKGTVSVLLGKGDGSFRPDVSFPAGQFPLAVAVADFNGDKNPDLAIADPCGTDPTCVTNGAVGILLGNGDGTFQPITYYGATGLDTARLRVADFNGDRRPDVVALNYQTSDITVFLGNGDGTLQAGVDYAVGANPLDVVAADFNSDRGQDLAVADEISNEISLLLNNGGSHVSLTSTPNPSHLHDPVTFTATVTPSFQGFGTPTGTATFKQGARRIGSAPLVNGRAMFTTSALPVGSHPIYVVYSGDSQYNPNKSRTVDQKVQP